MPNRKLPEQDHFGTLLTTEIDKERTKANGSSARLLPLGLLLALHEQSEKTPHDGWNATLLAGRLRIPAPLWAIDLLQKAYHDSIRGTDEKNETVRIATALGFAGQGKGGLKKAPLQRALQEKLHEDLFTMVRWLLFYGEPLKTACGKVAKTLKGREDLTDTVYPLRAPNPESLMKAYRNWEKKRGEEVLSLLDKGFASLPHAAREKFLAQFR
jgi:hypothetical protein